MTQKSQPTKVQFGDTQQNGNLGAGTHRFRPDSSANHSTNHSTNHSATKQTFGTPSTPDTALSAQRSAQRSAQNSDQKPEPKNDSLCLSIIIPVYNEKDTLEEIVQRVRAVDLSGFTLGSNLGSTSIASNENGTAETIALERELVLVDDGSTDGTHDILHRWQNEAPSDMRIIFHEKNGGKGAALRTGFQHATGDIIVIQDADLEYDPRDYSKLIQPILEGTTDVVYGSRFLGGPRTAMTMSHMLGNKGVTLIMNLVYGTVLSDMETCYKCFRREVVQDLTLHSRRFEIEPEITAKILKQGHTIFEVPIRYHGRAFHEGKKLTWRDGFNAVWTILKYRFVD